MRCSAGQIVIGIGFAVTVLSSSEGSSARDFWSKRNALRASAFEPNTRMQVLSSIHSKPSKFASKCLAYANILEVGRWDMGVPYSKMALSLHEESEHVCQGMYYSAHTLLKRTPCIHVYIIPTIHFVFIFIFVALTLDTARAYHRGIVILGVGFWANYTCHTRTFPPFDFDASATRYTFVLLIRLARERLLEPSACKVTFSGGGTSS